MLSSRLQRFHYDISKLALCSKRASTTVKAVDVKEEAMVDEMNLQLEEEIERKRNKSGLKEHDFRRLHGQIPFNEPATWAHSTLRYHRKLYGVYGASTNIDPRICWMSKEEFASKLEYDSLAEDRTIPDMIAEIKEKRRLEKETIRKRDEQVAKTAARIHEWKMELQSRIAKKVADAEAAKARKEKLIEEVRRHFGFKVDPKDERFKEMLEKKEKEQKKMEKMAKKTARDAKMLEVLKQQFSSAPGATAKMENKNSQKEQTNEKIEPTGS